MYGGEKWKGKNKQHRSKNTRTAVTRTYPAMSLGRMSSSPSHKSSTTSRHRVFVLMCRGVRGRTGKKKKNRRQNKRRRTQKKDNQREKQQEKRTEQKQLKREGENEGKQEGRTQNIPSTHDGRGRG